MSRVLHEPLRRVFRDLQNEEMTVEVTRAGWVKFVGDISGGVHFGPGDVRELVAFLNAYLEKSE